MRSSAHRSALALLSLAALTACSRTSGHSGPSNAPVFVSFVEVESNDTALTANIAGSLYIGDHYTIFGTTTDLGFDPFDGFAFFPEQSLELEFTLTPSDPGAILQICMVAPFGGPPPLCWNTTMSSGLGFATIAPGQELHLVVSSLWGTTDYRLDVTGYPPVYAATSGAQTLELAEGALAPYLEAPASSAAELEPEAPLLRGTLIHVDDEGEVRAYPIGTDREGLFVELELRTHPARD